MGYYLDADKITLDALKTRILDTDLVPSRSMLKEDINKKLSLIHANGVSTLEDLRKALKKSKNISMLSDKWGVDAKYLTLLRREIESFFPKAFSIKKFDWLAIDTIAKLESCGYKNSEKLYNAFYTVGLDEIAKELDIDIEVLNELSHLVNLTRIQWVSPLAARIIYLCGYSDIKKVAEADAGKMCEKMDAVNKEYGFFKGKIGLKDVKRLIVSAGFLAIWNM